MSRYLREHLRRTKADFTNYAVREPSPCDLSLVTGPFIWEREVEQAMAGFDTDRFRAYALPAEDPELVGFLADLEGVAPDHVMLTPGADFAIEVILRQYLDPGDRFGIHVPGFPRFAIVGKALPDVEVTTFTALPDLPRGCRLAALCSPSNPATTEIPADDLHATLAAHPDTLFCLDGVFDWYGSYRLTDVCMVHPNTMLLKSFSKIGLAGLRLGYIVAHPDLIEDLRIGLTPFSVPAVTQAVGLAVARSFSRLTELRGVLEARFAPLVAALGDRIVRESAVPFYLLKSQGGSTALARALAERGIGVVDGAHLPDIPDGHVRVCIGTAEQNERLLRTLEQIER